MINPAMLRHTVLLCTLLTISSTLHAEDLPAPIKALQAQGVEVVGTFEAPGGLLGYAGIIQNRPLAMYVTADREHASGGVAAVAQITPEIRVQLEANKNLMQQLGFSATPTMLYKDAAGHLQTSQGAPSKDKLTQMLGPL